MRGIKNFLGDERGIETLEYVIIAAVVAAVAILIYGSGWGASIKETLNSAHSGGPTPTL